eukprot:scaffold2272_cov101-Isochrysis_galbana.AAC.1
MLCVCVWCECGWRVVAIDAFPSGLVTATPPTSLRRKAGAGRARVPHEGASAGWRGRLDHRGRHGAREGPRVLLGPSSSAGVAADVEEHARRLEEGGAVEARID